MKMLAPLCLLLAVPALHAAEINKCVDANGVTVLTDEPCHSLKRKSAAAPVAPAPTAPARGSSLEKPSTTPPPPILPPAEQLVRPAPMPAPAEKPQQ